jgi:hypothetical protein
MFKTENDRNLPTRTINLNSACQVGRSTKKFESSEDNMYFDTKDISSECATLSYTKKNKTVFCIQNIFNNSKFFGRFCSLKLERMPIRKQIFLWKE